MISFMGLVIFDRILIIGFCSKFVVLIWVVGL